MVPHTIQIVFLSKNTQHVSTSLLNNYKLVLIFLYIIQFCHTFQLKESHDYNSVFQKVSMSKTDHLDTLLPSSELISF